jgi:hypothetical protein
MKKKLEAELMSLAHKILKLKNKSDIRILRDEAQKLHEKLSVLLFIEENFSEIKPTFSLEEAEVIITNVQDAISNTTSIEIEAEPALIPEVKKIEPEKIITILPEIKIEPAEIFIEEEPLEDISEEIKQETITLNFGLEVEEEKPFEKIIEEIKLPEPIIEPIKETIIEPIIEVKPKAKQVSLEDILEDIKPTPTFVKAPETPKNEDLQNKLTKESTHKTPLSINDKMRKTVTIGLNDKIAFVKHLFGGSDADFIRVISQLNTFDKYSEANDFVQNIVKPDYNNWAGKEEIEERFMHIIENKFA